MQQDDKAIQENLDRAQEDLERKVGQLKTAVIEKLEEKLETPRRVISLVEEAVAFVRAHRAAVAGIAAIVMLLVLARRVRAHAG